MYIVDSVTGTAYRADKIESVGVKLNGGTWQVEIKINSVSVLLGNGSTTKSVVEGYRDSLIDTISGSTTVSY